MNEILFPHRSTQRYYDSHYRFLLDILKAEGQEIKFYDDTRSERGFKVVINKRRVLVDFGDHGIVAKDWREFDVNFRYHYSKQKHGGLENTYPLTPISFYDWKEYTNLQKEIEYICNTDKILNNQRPGATAMERRTRIQKILKNKYDSDFDIDITDKKTFWKKINNCLVSVCVPGARNDILDRGQFQYMAFGACTISPPIDIELPYWRKLEAGVHYLNCRADYSDLIDIIEYCKDNRDKCRAIGRQAKQLFLDTSIPTKVWGWVNQCIKKLK